MPLWSRPSIRKRPRGVDCSATTARRACFRPGCFDDPLSVSLMKHDGSVSRKWLCNMCNDIVLSTVTSLCVPCAQWETLKCSLTLPFKTPCSQSSEGSFSAISRSTFAKKYSSTHFCNIRRDLRALRNVAPR